MRKITNLAAAAIGAAALAVMSFSAVAANASTIMPAAQHAAAQAAASTASPQLSAGVTGGCTPDGNGDGGQSCSYSVNPGPRVICGGYNGHVYWNDDAEGTIYIGTYGEVWDTCGDTTYVYLSWDQDINLHHGNDLAGSASDFHTVGVDYGNNSPVLSVGGVSNVALTVCSNYAYGWHCGSPVHV